MVTKLNPEINKVYFINNYSILHILAGSGGIEVDFRNYHNWEDKIIFLEKGQYIKFLTDDFTVRKIEVLDEVVFRNKEVRVLFKHLVALGYINFSECEACQHYLSDTVFSANVNQIIDVSSRQWFWQNPFNASKDEYHVIFDIKEVIDTQYKQQLNASALTELISIPNVNIHKLYADKVGATVKTTLHNKRLVESQKEVAFTEKSIKEIAFEFGYSDPSYFNRSFRHFTGKTPVEFRKQIEYQQRDLFVEDLYELLGDFHSSQRNVDFYAEKMHMSPRSLSRKVRERMQTSIGQLIRQALVQSSKKLLRENAPIHEVAFKLGFEEPNHFSAFFKHYTGTTPGTYRDKKYHQ